VRIHQLVVAASPGDAVTNSALDLQALLQRVGPSELFARHIDGRLGARVFPLAAYEARAQPDDLLIYHFSIGEPEVAAFLLRRRGPLGIIYHNITPAKYFETLDPGFAGLLAAGRAELELLRDRVEIALAVSPYNARELEALGYRDVRISPLPIDVTALAAVEPDPDALAGLGALDGPLILFVGQLLPHKRPELLLQAYHVLTRYLLPDAHLVLLGPSRNERYYRALLTLADELNLHRARIPGWLTIEQLVAHYRTASVFATMSEHEGVCVPLLEAMSFDVPVVARAFAAIPDTMGGGGLLLPPDDDPVLVAEALAEVLTNAGLATELVQRGRARLADFDTKQANATFLAHLLGALPAVAR
jgi:glycosyltransferase involved in cell wall biosynthesis